MWQEFRQLEHLCDNNFDNYNIYMSNFPGAKVRCTKHHVKPSMREKAGNLILHVGTNDLESDTLLEIIYKAVVDIALSLKKECNGGSILN